MRLSGNFLALDTTLFISSAMYSIPLEEGIATMLANMGEKSTTSFRFRLCQMGRILFSLTTNNPSSSALVHFFEKKLLLKITTPKSELLSPLSIEYRNLSPISSSVSSNQTLKPNAFSL